MNAANSPSFTTGAGGPGDIGGGDECNYDGDNNLVLDGDLGSSIIIGVFGDDGGRGVFVNGWNIYVF